MKHVLGVRLCITEMPSCRPSLPVLSAGEIQGTSHCKSLEMNLLWESYSEVTKAGGDYTDYVEGRSWT